MAAVKIAKHYSSLKFVLYIVGKDFVGEFLMSVFRHSDATNIEV